MIESKLLLTTDTDSSMETKGYLYSQENPRMANLIFSIIEYNENI
ncbi:hypothetical protein LEP1GSC050_1741 [Leptospira broomii serovar Hurstbridge str. 5399]|uniref:Uncharacterized protein n=1 Tax=Leptospira broomii serovar Hurstbridge str. 5399 TaxID=1049789 RepID=T0GA57_9LEPT|nr:hypothetical protein LEP1GSC050_1741 [Leptospira broomii serovar Hurstbridge str. 5399]